MRNQCTWINCNHAYETSEAMTDNGRAWGHLCPVHKRQYDAEMQAMSVNDGMFYTVERLHDLMVNAAGGTAAWHRYLFGPFGKRDQKPVDEAEVPATPL